MRTSQRVSGHAVTEFPSDKLIPTGTAKMRLDDTHVLLLLVDLLALPTPVLQEKSAPVSLQGTSNSPQLTGPASKFSVHCEETILSHECHSFSEWTPCLPFLKEGLPHSTLGGRNSDQSVAKRDLSLWRRCVNDAINPRKGVRSVSYGLPVEHV